MNRAGNRIRAFEIATVVTAASVLVGLGAWLALVDSFIRYQGHTPSGLATLLGSLWLAAGSVCVVLAPRLFTGSELAIGFAGGVALAAAMASAAIGAWVGLVLSGVLVATVLSLRVRHRPSIVSMSSDPDDESRVAV